MLYLQTYWSYVCSLKKIVTIIVSENIVVSIQNENEGDWSFALECLVASWIFPIKFMNGKLGTLVWVQGL